MKYRFFLFSVMLLACMAIYAAEESDNINTANINTTSVEIKSALGFTLGEEIPVVRPANKNSRNSPLFSCPKPFRNFTSCYLSTTHDKKIFMIRSEVFYPDEEDAKAEFKLILELLEKKYQCKFSDISAQQFDEDLTLYKVKSNTGKKFIGLLLRKHLLRIFYTDEDLQEQSTKQLLDKEREQNNNADVL